MRTFKNAVLVQVVLDAEYRSCCSVNSVKALKELKQLNSTRENRKLTSSFADPPTDF